MFDPEDKRNLNVDKTPLNGGAGGLVTHKLKELSPSRYEFKPTFGAVLKILRFVFAVVVFFLLIFYIYRKILEVQSPISFNFIENPIMIIPIFIIFIYVVEFVKISISIFKPLIFDKNAGLFWKGFYQPDVVCGGDKKKEIVQLEKIQGLQILKKSVKGRMDTYIGFELNLVLSDSERVNVIDHGNLQRMREDAQKLGRFLNVPVLDEVRQ